MRRLLILMTGAALAVATTVGGALPAWAKDTPAAASFFYLDSDPGDPIASGLTYVVPQTTKTMRVEGGRQAHQMLVVVTQGPQTYTLTLSRTSPHRITSGKHTFGYQDPDDYELALTGQIGGCGSLTGNLDLRKLQFSSNGKTVTRLDLTFTAYCPSSGSGEVRGHVAYRSTRSVELPRTPAVLRGGQTLSNQRELLNIQGTSGAIGQNEIKVRLIVVDGKAVLIRQVWPDLNGFPGPLDDSVWSTPTDGSGADHLTLSKSGRLSLLTPEGTTVWSVKPKGAGKGTFLVADPEGQLLLVSSRFMELWSVGA